MPPPIPNVFQAPRRSPIKVTNSGLVKRAEQTFRWQGSLFTAVAEFCMDDVNRPWGYGRTSLIHWSSNSQRSGTLVWDSMRTVGRAPSPPLFFGVEEQCPMTEDERKAATTMLRQLIASVEEAFA